MGHIGTVFVNFEFRNLGNQSHSLGTKHCESLPESILIYDLSPHHLENHLPSSSLHWLQKGDISILNSEKSACLHFDFKDYASQHTSLSLAYKIKNDTKLSGLRNS